VFFKGLIKDGPPLFFSFINLLFLHLTLYSLLYSAHSVYLSLVLHAQSLVRRKIDEDELDCSLLIAIIKLAFADDKYIIGLSPVLAIHTSREAIYPSTQSAVLVPGLREPYLFSLRNKGASKLRIHLGVCFK
jgi:hypothetical protein